MTVLVTGATGLLGNNVVRLALRRGHRVRCLVRRSSDARPLQGLSVEVVTGDVRDRDAVDRAVSGVRLAIHAAGLVGIGRTGIAAMRDVNVGGALAVARCCRRHDARMVHVSTVDTLPFGTRESPTSEEDEPVAALPIPYMITKREAEEVVLAEVERGLDGVVVNPGYLLGPFDWKPSSGRLLLAVARGRGRLAPPGGNDFCHATDVAEGTLAAGERGRRGERYILSGESLSYLQAFETFARVTGAPAPLGVVPRRVLLLAGRVGDLVGAVTGAEPDFNSATAEASAVPHHFSSEKARRELGYAPRGAEAAARDAWRWFRTAGYA